MGDHEASGVPSWLLATSRNKWSADVAHSDAVLASDPLSTSADRVPSPVDVFSAAASADQLDSRPAQSYTTPASSVSFSPQTRTSSCMQDFSLPPPRVLGSVGARAELQSVF